MAKAKTGAGSMTEQIDIVSTTPIAASVSSITRTNQIATVTTAAVHGLTSGDYVTMAGATQSEYNGEFSITVTSTTTFTYTVSGTPVTPATGTITALYTSDSQGGMTTAPALYTVASGLWAKIEAMSAGEQLAAGGIAAIGSYNVTVYYRADIKVSQQVVWRKYLEPAAKTYEIHSVQPNKDEPRAKLDLEISVVEG